MKMATRKNIHNLSQGPPNPGLMQEKGQKEDFLKKDSQKLKKNLVLGSYDSPEVWDAELGAGSFFAF